MLTPFIRILLEMRLLEKCELIMAVILILLLSFSIHLPTYSFHIFHFIGGQAALIGDGLQLFRQLWLLSHLRLYDASRSVG